MQHPNTSMHICTGPETNVHVTLGTLTLYQIYSFIYSSVIEQNFIDVAVVELNTSVTIVLV